jgi:hypothetical protein
MESLVLVHSFPGHLFPPSVPLGNGDIDTGGRTGSGQTQRDVEA